MIGVNTRFVNIFRCASNIDVIRVYSLNRYFVASFIRLTQYRDYPNMCVTCAHMRSAAKKVILVSNAFIICIFLLHYDCVFLHCVYTI